MTEKDLLSLNFEKAEWYDDDLQEKIYYYTYYFNDNLSLITDFNYEIDSENEWAVEFFDAPEYSIQDAEELKQLINLIEKNKK